MKRVGRWTWMLLTLLLLLCTTAFAETIECGSIELEQPVEVALESYDSFQYTLTAPVDGTRVKVEWLSDNKDAVQLYINGGKVSTAGGICTLHEENTIKVNPASSKLIPLTVRFVLHEYRNDEHEPNDVTPTELHDGDSVKFVLDDGDMDWFSIKTEKPGQDIALTFSGFNYADRTAFSLVWNRGWEIEKNGTVFLHAGEPGAYQFSLYKSWSGEISRSMEIHLLDGDENELNDTKETATPLPIGTDAAFSIGGIGDEDWFSFEAVPEEGQAKLYTLRLLDFDFENPEIVCYEIYAPDGNVVVPETEISSRHARVLSCSQQGQYAVRLYPKEKYDYYSEKYNVSIQRAALRIRVEEGGDDPYESNDTWLDAAYIEPGQLISHVLSSGDTDWFCFTASEDYMTVHIVSNSGGSAGIYTGQELAEYGDDASCIWGGNSNYKSFSNLYWKLGEKGLYYIKLIGGSSEKICSTMISLLPLDEIEDNDVWYRATPLYEDFTQAFDISAHNDMDWFRFTVPEGDQKVLRLNVSKTDTGEQYEYMYFELYREAYFDNQDDGSLYKFDIASSTSKTTKNYAWDLEPGTYYLSVGNTRSTSSPSRIQKFNIHYKLAPRLNNDTIATAAPLTEEEWQDVWQKGYFSIGEHKAGEVVQIQRDEGGDRLGEYTVIYNADGQSIASTDNGSYSFRIPTDGVYYLRVPASVKFSENEPTRTTRVRYYTHNDEIGAADTITMRPNESVFLDVWFSPDISLSVESEVENLTYDRETGYLTAPNTPEGSADLVFSNGYPEGDEKRVEAVTHVIWSENPLSDISISNAPQSLPVGSSVQLEAAVSPEDYICHISWKSSDTSVLRVLSNGKVVAVGQGEAVITASIGEATSSVTITVTGEQPGESGLTGVSLDRYTLTLYAGEEAEQLTATLKPEGTEAAIHWTSSNQTAATVSQDGKVTPLAAGVTVVTAAAGDYRASCIVTVQPKRVRVTGIRFDEPTHTLMMGSTVTLQPIIAPDDATVKNLTWVSSDEQTATVSRTGIVTALSVGETTITATTVDGGYSAEIKIIVTAAAQLGDVNGDGYIDAADALLCLRASVGLITLTPEQEAAADVNHDGLIDAGDAILILRYDARLIPSLN
ncbi:MAG: Ig-like domain-containing protein [Oscillospiraceae bacterium]